jgi:hypothetical protein
MFDPVGAVSIALGSVVLDRPDQTGRYFARDLAGGWAYLVGDAEGDNRFRGHGVCEGGLDTTLRCAFLSAANRIPHCGYIRILVETRQAHRMMVQLAMRDPHVIAAIAGRPVSIMTRPDERSLYQVRSAAERAASNALRDREHAEWRASAEEDATGPSAADARAGDTAFRRAAGDTRAASAGPGELGAMHDWRAWRGTGTPRPATAARATGVRANEPDQPAIAPTAAVRRLVRPLMEGARNRLAAAGLLPPPPPRRNRAVMDWLQDLDTHVAAVTNDLQDAGA